MRVLITGISGFVGLPLGRRLQATGAEVFGTFVGRAPDLPGARLLEADLRDAGQVKSAVAAAAPDTVIHLGGLSHVGRSWSAMDDYFQVNVIGTENLLREASGARTLFASSAEVYGVVPEEEQPLVESRPVAPRSPYGLTKAAGERLALGAGAVVVRSFNAAGPGQAPEFALPAFSRQLAAIAAGDQPPVLQVGNLEARRDFLHVEDVVEGYVLLAGRDEAEGVYNLGSGRAFSIREALDLLIARAGLEVEIEIDPERYRPADIPLLVADASRLRGLGWEPRHCLEKAVADLWAAR